MKFVLALLGTFIVLCGLCWADAPSGDNGSTDSDTATSSTPQTEEPTAEEPVASDAEKPPFFEVHGFFQNNSSQRIITSNQFPFELLKFENRAQLELTHWGVKWDGHFKADAVWDPSNQFSKIDIREAYLTRRGSRLDLTLGKEIITWGVGDLVFLTDVFPKDWEAFITGAPIEYLKKGSIAVKANYYVRGANVEGIWIPVFEGDTLPTGNKLAFSSPFPPDTPVGEIKPLTTFADSQVALRISSMIRDYDTSIYLYSGWDPRPSPNFALSALERHRLKMGGMSFQGPFGKSLLSGEVAYYSTEDSSGTNPVIPNSSLRWLLGSEKTLSGNRTVSFQVYQELSANYGAYLESLPAGMSPQPELRTEVTARYRDTLHRETVHRTAFVLYSPSEHDYFVNLEWKQDLSDTEWFAIGINLFGGQPHTPYGQFKEDGNLYVTFRHSF